MIEHLRANIFIADKYHREDARAYSTKYNRWQSECRNVLFDQVTYNEITDLFKSYVIPKISYCVEHSIYLKLIEQNECMLFALGSGRVSNRIYYRAAGGGYFCLFKDVKSETWINGIKEDVKAEKFLQASNSYSNTAICAALSSSLFYWYYIANTDCRNLSSQFIESFCCPLKALTDKRIQNSGKRLFKDYETNVIKMDTVYKTGNRVVYYEYHPKLSKPIIDEIDELLAKHYGFTEEELDFIINYDIKYRMGDELSAK